MEKIKSRIIVPTLKGLQAENIPYRGFIFFGLIKVGDNPMVIEYNARMGDPETEAVIPRIQSDVVELLVACAKGNLKECSIEISAETAVTVMMVSGGYPGDYTKGKPINGLSAAKGALLFHAGTREAASEILTDGGRVLAATGQGSTIDTARQAAYRALAAISFEQAYFRRDIGVDLLSV